MSQAAFGSFTALMCNISVWFLLLLLAADVAVAVLVYLRSRSLLLAFAVSFVALVFEVLAFLAFAFHFRSL